MPVDTYLARRRYADAITHGSSDPRLRHAFESVAREDFLGPGPWQVWSEQGYALSASTDPTMLYDDIVVALMADKKINNGQPSLHAQCLSSAGIRPGERALHVGCGGGYYSAILAELVTPSGTVTAWDIEPALVSAAAANLARWANISVNMRSGTEGAIPPSDVIYVCAGCTQPFKGWVDALPIGGRLVFPLTPGWDLGGMLMVTREVDRLAARFLCHCSFIPSVGGSVRDEEEGLRAAFAAGEMDRVRELHFGERDRDTPRWAGGSGWWLSTH